MSWRLTRLIAFGILTAGLSGCYYRGYHHGPYGHPYYGGHPGPGYGGPPHPGYAPGPAPGYGH